MKVHVVMGNDFPDAVFSSEEKAAAFIEAKKAETAKNYPTSAKGIPRIYWRSYEFELDKGAVEAVNGL